MDLQMPVMNGFQATDYIRNTLKSPIPIIALTADINTEDIEHCMTIGMNDYIAKPVNERVLYNKIIGLIKSNIPTIESEITLDFESQTQKISDLNYLNKITKSNPKLMIEMIEVYLKQTPPLLTIIEDSLKNIDGQSLKMAIHKLIPSFTIMGIHPEIENMAKEIQENAHTISTAEETHKKTLHLINVCAQTCKELEQELINLKK
jgi:CheY-like chemotaxis protein